MGNEESNPSQTAVNRPMNGIETNINTNMAYYQDPQGKTDEIPLIALSLNANSFTPGDIIKGVVIVQPKTLIKISQIIVKLVLIQGWELQHDNIKNIVNDIIFDHVNLSQYDNLKTGIITLYPNKYVFDFNLTIPLNTPPTFFFPKIHNNAYNIYFVRVEMMSEKEKMIKEKALEDGVNPNDLKLSSTMNNLLLKMQEDELIYINWNYKSQKNEKKISGAFFTDEKTR